VQQALKLGLEIYFATQI